jgi:hypothetical protein
VRGGGGAVGGPSSLAAELPAAADQVVVLCSDAEVGDLVAQGVAVNTERPGGSAEVPPVALQGSDDELPLELPPGLLQRHAPAYELVDDLEQASIQILVCQERIPLEKGREASA